MRMILIMIVMIMVFDEDDNGGISDHGKYLDGLESFQSIFFFALLREHVIKSFLTLGANVAKTIHALSSVIFCASNCRFFRPLTGIRMEK